MNYAIISNSNLGRLELHGAYAWHKGTHKNEQMSIKNDIQSK